MKKIILSALVVAIASTFSFSQGNTPPPRPQKSPDDRANMQVERVNKEVSLTDEQKPKIKEIIMKRDQSRQDLNAQYTDKNSPEFREANRKLMQDSEKQIDAVLTPEQKEKRKQMREQQRANKGGVQGQPPPPAGQDAPPPPQPK